MSAEYVPKRRFSWNRSTLEPWNKLEKLVCPYYGVYTKGTLNAYIDILRTIAKVAFFWNQTQTHFRRWSCSSIRFFTHDSSFFKKQWLRQAQVGRSHSQRLVLHNLVSGSTTASSPIEQRGRHGSSVGALPSCLRHRYVRSFSSTRVPYWKSGEAQWPN